MLRMTRGAWGAITVHARSVDALVWGAAAGRAAGGDERALEQEQNG
jgi:hypothetical protein